MQDNNCCFYTEMPGKKGPNRPKPQKPQKPIETKHIKKRLIPVQKQGFNYRKHLSMLASLIVLKLGYDENIVTTVLTPFHSNGTTMQKIQRSSLLFVVSLLAMPGLAFSKTRQEIAIEVAKRGGLFTLCVVGGTMLQNGIDAYKAAGIVRNPLLKTSKMRQIGSGVSAALSLKALAAKARQLKNSAKPTITRTPQLANAPAQTMLGSTWAVVKANPMIDAGLVLGIIFASKPDIIQAGRARFFPTQEELDAAAQLAAEEAERDRLAALAENPAAQTTATNIQRIVRGWAARNALAAQAQAQAQAATEIQRIARGKLAKKAALSERMKQVALGVETARTIDPGVKTAHAALLTSLKMGNHNLNHVELPVAPIAPAVVPGVNDRDLPVN